MRHPVTLRQVFSRHELNLFETLLHGGQEALSQLIGPCLKGDEHACRWLAKARCSCRKVSGMRSGATGIIVDAICRVTPSQHQLRSAHQHDLYLLSAAAECIVVPHHSQKASA